MINQYIRKWPEIPISGTLSNIYLTHNKFGLNILPASVKFIQCQTVLRNALKTSPNDSIKELWKSTNNHTNIPEYFSDFFTSVNKIHHYYNTRLASRSSYSLPRVRTNYGKFNIRFNGASIWNSIDESIKDLSKIKFKKCLISKILDKYLI